MGGLIGLLWLGVGGGALLIAAGELAPAIPFFDTINHFRPHLAIVVGTFAVAALPVGRWAIFVVGAIATGWATLAVTTIGSCAAPDDGNAPSFTVLTFNIHGINLELEAIEQRIREANADAVILIEYAPIHTPIASALADLYPAHVDCAQERGCFVGMLARDPFTLASTSGRNQGTPPIVSARFSATEDRPAFTLIGTHIARPFDGGGRWQARDLDRLAEAVNATEGPMVVAGDFNATPWSHAMTGFRDDTGLCGAPGYRPTWPVWLAAMGLPIDHVLVSTGFGVSAETLPPAGSDHLPVRAAISFP